MNMPTSSFGDQLRHWRQRRKVSQLDLACLADISTRHLSFIETGRSRPSREMVENLAECLEIPLRERNALMMAAGFAPTYAQRALTEPEMQAARDAIDLLLRAHEPYPALAVDRYWNLVASNRVVPVLIKNAAAHLLEPPINVLRLSLHPQGLAPLILNEDDWRGAILDRLRHQIDATGDSVLQTLFTELSGYARSEPAANRRAPLASPATQLVLPLKIQSHFGPISLISTTTVFGTPVEVTLSELAIESFFPADPASAQALRSLAREAGLEA